MLNNLEDSSGGIKTFYVVESYLSIVLCSLGLITIAYTFGKVGKYIPSIFTIALVSYLVIYVIKLTRSLLADNGFLDDVQTVITTVIVCAIDFFMMLMIFEIGLFEAKLESDSQQEFESRVSILK